MRRIVLRSMLSACAAYSALFAQTKVDLQNQSRGIDFTGAASTKPAKTGTAIPPVCSTGEVFFLTTAPAGANLYFCISPNTWVAQAGSSGSGNGSYPDLAVTSGGANLLIIGQECTLSTPCGARVGGTSYVYTSSATVTVTSGTPTVRIYISDGSDGSPAGAVKVANSASAGAVVCSPSCTVENGRVAFPGMSIPLAVWTASTPAVWDSTGMDMHSELSTKPSPTAGYGVTITQGSSDVISLDTTVVPRKYAGSGAPGSIANSVRGDFYTDIVNNDLYSCFALGPCTAVAGGNWVKLGGSGATSGGGTGGGTSGGGTSGGATVACDVFTPSTLCYVDDFMNMNSTGMSSFFSAYTFNGGFVNEGMTVTNRPGILQLGTGFSGGSGGSVMLLGGQVNTMPSIAGGFFGSAATGTITVDAQIQGTSAIKAYIGFGTTRSSLWDTNFLGIRFDTSKSDLTWVCVNGATTTPIPGASPDTSWHRFTLNKTGANAFTCKVDAGAVSSTITSTLASDSYLGIALGSGDGSNRQLSVDRIAVNFAGLTR